MSTIAYMLPGTTAPDDCYLYSQVVSPRTRPDAQRRPVHSKSSLCEVCLGVLEYLAYVAEECRSRRSTADLPQVATHHQNLAVWLDNFDINCHLCYFLILHMRLPAEEILSDFQLEVSWSNFAQVGNEEDFRRGRFYVAITRLSLEWTESNHHCCMRLQLWPSNDFARLFLNLFAPPSASSSSSRSGDDTSHTGPQVTSIEVQSGSPISGTSSDGKDSPDDTNDNDDNEEFYVPGSGADGSNGDGYGVDGSNSGEDDDDDDDDDGDQSRKVVVMSAGSTSQLTQKLVAQWLARCQNNEDGQHLECNRTGDHWLPTRLIDVNYTSDNPVLRLASPAKTPELFEDRRYITLSHCWREWGSKELPVLKKSNEQDRFHNGIELEKMPLTFQHAIEVAHWLQVRWLWIDSMCIIQDSDEDWLLEASLMHDVYKQGFLNIAANSAADARDGLFQPRPLKAVQPLQLYMPGVEQEIFLTVDERNMFEWMNTTPLSKRAWVFQERHLARRVLQFTDYEVFWECYAKAPYFACETFARGAPLNTIFDDKLKLQSTSLLKQPPPSVQEMRDLWENLCQMYSEKHLSHRGDKLVALLGLAKEFKGFFPDDEYFAGMWLSTMPESFLWEVEERHNSPTQRQFRYRGEQENCGSVVDIKAGSSSDGIGDRLTFKLNLFGFVRRITIKDNLAVDRVYPNPTFDNKKELLVHQGQQQLTFGNTSFSVPPMIMYSLDSNIQSEITEAYFLFLTWSLGSKKTPSMELSGLLLKSTAELDTFERIGTLRITGYGAIATKYQVKQGVADPAGAWDSFNQMLRARRNEVTDDAVPDLAQLHLDASATEKLYDGHDWTIDDNHMEHLKPQSLILQ